MRSRPALLHPADPSAFPSPKTEASGLRSWLRIPWDYAAMAGGLLYWGVLGLSLTLIGGTLSFLLPSRIGEPIGRRIHYLIFKYFVVYLRLSRLVYADLTPLVAMGKISQPMIVAANHSSLWDAVFIIAHLRRSICVMKQSVLRNPFLGGGSRLSGYISNGSTSRMIRGAADSLKRGGQLLIFPEGTRTFPSARWINPLKGGCALIAIRAKVPIYPLFIRSDTRFLQKGWPLWRRPHFPVHLSIEVGEPIVPLPGESALELTRRLQAVYEQELARPHPLRRQIAQ